MKQRLIVFCGPTASGKTAAAIDFAEKNGGEIISADSMQVYKFMDIGTAKPTPAEQNKIIHRMIDVITPDEEFSVARYQAMARESIKEAANRGKTPVLVGGSGFYINAALGDINFTESERDLPYRAELTETANKLGAEFLHSMLMEIDPASHTKIHPNNVKRIIRALEFFKITGRRISDENESQKKSAPFYDAEIFYMDVPRNELYERINSRADKMFADGLIDETENLLRRGYSGDLPAMMGLGYKEAVMHLAGKLNLKETVGAVKQATRNYAKRQETWFKNSLRGEIKWRISPKN